MNLGQIRQRVGEELQYAPDLEEHRADIREIIQRVYDGLGAEKSWPWLVKRAPIYSFPDISLEQGDVTKATGYGVRNLSVSAPLGLSGVMYPAEDAGAYQYIQAMLAGAEFDLADRANRNLGNGNWELGPFVIELATPSETLTRLDLDPRAVINTIAGDEGGFVIRFPRTRLPPDLATILSIKDDEGRPLLPLSPSAARSEIFEFEDGPVRYFLEDMGHEPTYMPMVWPGISDGVPTKNADQSVEYGFDRENWPVRREIAAALSSGSGGGMQGSTTYKVFASWFYSGRFGPPSNIVTLTAAAGDDYQIDLTQLPDLPTTGANIEYGRRLSFWVATGEGAFVFRGFKLTTGTSHTITGDDDEFVDEQLHLPRWDEWFPGGPYRYIRLMPRGDQMRRFTLEYRKRPRRLIEDTDQPEFAENYHHVLVWLTCMELASRFSDSGFFVRMKANAKEAMRKLNRLYFPSEQYAKQAGMVGEHPGVLHQFIGPDIRWGG